MINQKLFFVVVFAISLLSACGQNTQNADTATIGEAEVVPATEYQKMLNDGQNVQIVDVRTPGEYSQSHLPGAVNIDYNSPDFADDIAVLDKESPVYIYCRSGNRSSRSSEIMIAQGFSKVIDLKGGITSWIESGYQVVR